MIMYFQNLKKAILKNRTTSIIVFFALLIFCTTACNSHGYFHGDEHYQIIEFAGVKLGTHQSSELAWEFSEKLRPSLQTTLVFFIISILKIINVINPYTQLFILRLITALFAIYVIKFSKLELNKAKNRAV